MIEHRTLIIRLSGNSNYPDISIRRTGDNRVEYFLPHSARTNQERRYNLGPASFERIQRLCDKLSHKLSVDIENSRVELYWEKEV